MIDNGLKPHFADAQNAYAMTVGALLRVAAGRHPERTALIDDHAKQSERRRITYQQLLTSAERGARALAALYPKKTHIAVWSPNSLDWVVLQAAAALAGLPLVMLNPNLRPAEVAYILKHSRATAVFTALRYRDSEMFKIVTDLRPDLPDLKAVYLLTELGDLPDDQRHLPEVGENDLALLQYTSGTTGNPKGVLLSHRNVISVGVAGATAMALPDAAIWLLVLPLASVGGSVFAMIGAWSTASSMVVMSEFDPGLMIRLIDEERVTFFNGPTTVHIRLIDHPKMQEASFASLRSVTCGGSTVTATLIERIERAYGAECLTTYGLTETSGTVGLITPGDTIEHKCNTVGRPLPGIEVRIQSVETHETLGPGESGEICVRSPGGTAGYFEMPQATSATIDPRGWLHTGDLGQLDEAGYLSITGRLKDMIKRGGHNVYPREIEDVLATHPAVAESAVFAIPHGELGEEIAAAVRLTKGTDASGDELKAWLFTRIAPHKVPRAWHFVDSFPINANGKIKKFELQEKFA